MDYHLEIHLLKQRVLKLEKLLAMFCKEQVDDAQKIISGNDKSTNKWEPKPTMGCATKNIPPDDGSLPWD